MPSYSTMEEGQTIPLVQTNKPKSNKMKAAAAALLLGAFALGFAAAAAVTPSSKTAFKFVVYDGPKDLPPTSEIAEFVPPESPSTSRGKVAPRLAADVFDTSSKLTSTSSKPSGNVGWVSDNDIFDTAWGNWSSPPVVVANSPHFTIKFIPEDGPDGYFKEFIYRVDKAVYESCNRSAGHASVFWGNSMPVAVTTYDWPCLDASCEHETEYYTSGDHDELLHGCEQGKKFSLVYNSEPVCATEKRALLSCLDDNYCNLWDQPMQGSVDNSSRCEDYGAGGALGAEVCMDVYNEIMQSCDECTALGQAAAECAMANAVKNYQRFAFGWDVRNVPGIDCNCKDMCWYDIHGQGYDEHTCKDPAAPTELMVFPPQRLTHKGGQKSGP